MSSIIGGPVSGPPPQYTPPPPPPSGGAKIPILFGAVAALLAACVYLFFQLGQIREDVHSQLSDMRDQLMAELAKEHETSAVTTQTSKKNVEKLSAEVAEARRAASQLAGDAKVEADKHADELAAKLQQAQQEQAKQVSSLTSDVSNVKEQESTTQKNVGEVTNQVGNLKTQQTATQAQLEKTVADLKSTVGDLGVQSDRIATNGKELAALRALGERNYTDFKVAKAKKPEKVGDVQILLVSADPKKNRYTIRLIADDKTLDKKDKELNEPVQFYMSRASQPYELVVNQINKDMIVGYVSAPKVQQPRGKASQ